MNKKHFVLGGDINKSLNEGYQLNFQALFKDAYAITRKHYIALITACILTLTILASCFTLLLDSSASLGEVGNMLINYVITLLIAPPLLTGLQMMGIHHAIGLKTKPLNLFNYFNIFIKLSLASMMISLISNIISMALTQTLGDLGFQLSIVFLLYLNMAFSLVYPLIAEKKLSAQMALKISFKLVHKNLSQFTLMFMILAVLFVLSLLPYGLGLLLFIPFYFNLMGIVYRQICGIGVVAMEVGEDGNTPNDEFEA
ncbi:hypothetical protein [Psychromonas sp. MME2]|uniref:hypothetical protein n=1 Tax=unclassified Psychromonas TaxID=2614957 RepID=UPI00339BB9AA